MSAWDFGFFLQENLHAHKISHVRSQDVQEGSLPGGGAGGEGLGNWGVVLLLSTFCASFFPFPPPPFPFFPQTLPLQGFSEEENRSHTPSWRLKLPFRLPPAEGI